MSIYQSINPATGQLVREYPQHTPAQVENALAVADKLFRSAAWRDDRAPRLQILEKLGALLDSEAEKIAAVVTAEMGKPTREAVGEVKLCAKIAQYYAAEAEKMLAPVPQPTRIGEAWVEHAPVGVLLAVEPWNFPIYQVISVLAPALAVGNPIILKHAPSTPGCALLIEELVRKAGAPEGALTNLFLTNEQVSDLIGDPRIAGVALTGSERAGTAVASRASQMLKKSTLELGGSDVFVVLDDADIEKAAAVGASARLFNAGQACTAAKRFVVQRPVAEKFLELVKKAMTSTTIGDPTDPKTTMGPLSSEGALKNLEHQVETATKHGAKLLFGGKRLDRPGFFFEPSLLTDMKPDNPMYAAELFGPGRSALHRRHRRRDRRARERLAVRSRRRRLLQRHPSRPQARLARRHRHDAHQHGRGDPSGAALRWDEALGIRA